MARLKHVSTYLNIFSSWEAASCDLDSFDSTLPQICMADGLPVTPLNPWLHRCSATKSNDDFVCTSWLISFAGVISDSDPLSAWAPSCSGEKLQKSSIQDFRTSYWAWRHRITAVLHVWVCTGVCPLDSFLAFCNSTPQNDMQNEMEGEEKEHLEVHQKIERTTKNRRAMQSPRESRREQICWRGFLVLECVLGKKHPA